MRPLACYIATSLDGCIAGPNGEIDWLFTGQDYGYGEFFAGVDTVVMGRKTYDLCLSFGDYPYPDIQTTCGRGPAVGGTIMPRLCPVMSQNGSMISGTARRLPRRKFQYIHAQPFSSGLVQLTYRRTA